MSLWGFFFGTYLLVGIGVAEAAMKGSIVLGHEDFGAWSYILGVLFWPVILFGD